MTERSEEKDRGVLAVVVPCYNEEDVLDITTRRLEAVIGRLVESGEVSADSYILYVNDGSSDTTWQLIERYHNEGRRVGGVNLAANAGQQNALLAGMTVAKADADMIVTIDADLQDSPEAIPEMVKHYNDGCDIVYGVRNNRDSDSWFKRTTAQTFYRLMRRLGVKDVDNRPNFRLMSRRAVEQLLLYRERNLFLPGMVPLIGYKTANVYYARDKRAAGESKYSTAKLVNIAVDAITSFSSKPVRMILMLGVIFLIITLLILIYVIVSIVRGLTVPGWSSLMLSIWFCSGCILTALGIVGEYIGKIYIEVKDRPRYNIDTVIKP